MSNWIEQEAKRNNRNLLLINILGLAAGAVFLVVLYTDTNTQDDHTIPMICLGGVLLLAVWNIYKGLRRMGEIQVTPLWKQVSAHGDVAQISAQVEHEQQTQGVKYKRLTLTNSWLVHRGTFNSVVAPLGDLAWAYKKITKVYSSYIIPIGKLYSTVILTRHRERVEVSLRQRETDALLAELAARVPWAFFGYSNDLAVAWQKDPAGVVSAVDSRYRQFSAKSSATTNPA